MIFVWIFEIFFHWFHFRAVVTEVGIDTATNAISVVVLYVDFGEQKVLYPGKGELRRAVPKRLLNVPVQV